MPELFKPITPKITELKTGTPVIKHGDKYIVAGIGGDFIPNGVTVIPGSGGTDTSDAIAVTPSDVSEGLVFYSAEGRQVGTMPDTAASVDKNIVTVPAGRIREEQTLTVPSGSVSVDGGTVNISAGYIESCTLSVEPSYGLSVSGAKVTVGKGYIAEDAEITIPSGSVSIDGDRVNVSVGYVEEQTLTVEMSSGVTVNKNIVTVGKGYVSEDVTATIPMGRVLVGSDDLDDNVIVDGNYSNKVTITEGYHNDRTVTIGNAVKGYTITPSVNEQVIFRGTYITGLPLRVEGDANLVPENIKKDVSIFGVPGAYAAGFELVKVTDYHPAREGFTAPSQVVVSGIGTIGSVEDDWYTDGSAANGTYVITEDTRYKKGYSRVYKQVDGKYYLAGYDSSADEWSDTGSQWFIGTSPTSYGWVALLYYEGENIPSGSAIWQNMDYGSATVTTSITNEEVSSLIETSLAQSVTAFDTETAEWTEGDSVDISSYSITPQINGIYFAQGGKLIGQHIDRELHIPEDGLVRRWKAVDGHFVDTVWGTEMKPSGDVSFDELGYCGNHAAPMVVTTNSYLSCPNTLTIHDNMTMNVFFRSFSVYGNALVFGFGDAWTGDGYVTGFLNSGFGFDSKWAYGLVDGNTYGKWRMFTLTIEENPIEGNDSKYTCRFYCNGKFISEHNFSWVEWCPNDIGVFSRAAIGGSSGEYISGQIDEACIWDRILTAEEISDMAKGLEGFNWDVPKKPYIQMPPVLYAPLNTDSHSIPTGQYIEMEGSGGTNELTPYIRDGALWSYGTIDGEIRYDDLYCDSNYKEFYSGSFTVCVDFCFVDYIDPDREYSRAGEFKVINSLKVYKVANSPDIMLQYAGVSGSTAIPKETWVTLVARCDKGTVTLFTSGFQNGQGVTTETAPADGTVRTGTGLKMGMKNVRFYNRALSIEEIHKLSGIKETE